MKKRNGHNSKKILSIILIGWSCLLLSVIWLAPGSQAKKEQDTPKQVKQKKKELSVDSKRSSIRSNEVVVQVKETEDE